MSIFDAIRLVADSDISLSTKGFFLRLIPKIDSRKLSSTWSVDRMARSLDLSESAVKRYRRSLIAIGALERSRGWKISTGQSVISDTDQDNSVISDTDQDNSVISDTDQDNSVISEPLNGSDLTPCIHYSSTSVSTKDRSIARDVEWGFIPIRFRPDLKDRKPAGEIDLIAWSREWSRIRPDTFRFGEWISRVGPFLTVDERLELFTVLSTCDRPNLAFATSIVNRLISGRKFRKQSSSRVPVAETDDDDLIEAIG